jgi:predicted Zn-dependent protease
VTPEGLPHPADVVERAIGAAGGPCICIVEESHEAEVRFANNTATTDGVRLDRRVTAIRIVETAAGLGAGVARRGGDVDVADLVDAAERDASVADDAYPLVEGAADPAFGDDAPGTDLSTLDGVLGALARAFPRAERAGTVLSGFAEHHVVTTYLGSTTGLRRRHVQPTGALQLVGRSGGRSAWAGAGTTDFTDVGIETLEERIGRGLDWAARQVEIPAGRYEVVLPPESVADMMTYLVSAASGRESEEGRTVFSRPGGGTRIGESLTPTPFDLWSDPREPGLECAEFLAVGASGVDLSVFDNGLPLGRTDWIREGRLAHLRYHRAGAERSGVVAAAPVDNLVLSLPGASGSVDDLVSRTERGLLLTCLWYIRQVDPQTLLLTGLTRDGVYLVEDGRVVGATNNFRFNESPVDLLARATEASATTRTLGREFGEWRNRTAMPALRIPDFNMSSVSQAN